MTDADRIAEFLARKGATVVDAGVAYGVSPESDRAKRMTDEASERRAEQYAEQVREAYHVGGSRARDELVHGGRY